MSDLISRRECVFLAPLDTVLQQTSAKFDSLLRFFALFNSHFVVTDSQLLDNRIFREKAISQNLERLFYDDSGDGFPLFLVSKRTADRTLAEILVVDLGGAELRPTKYPMKFSSITSEQQERLNALHARRKVTLRSFSSHVGYPVDWLRRVSKLVERAGYAKEFRWPAALEDRAGYHELLVGCLGCRSLAQQAGIAHPATRSFLKRLIEKIRLCPPQEFSRTVVEMLLDQARRDVALERRLWATRRDDIEKAFGAVRSMAAYAYLRNFSDASRFTLLLDHTHWLASSVVNKELRQKRPEVEWADEMAERVLDLHEGAFKGFGAARQLAMSRLLKSCGFNDRADWQKILELRRDPAFGQRLTDISRSKGAEASELLYDHARICLEELLGRPTHKDLVIAAVSTATIGISGEAIKGAVFGCWTATGFAGPGIAAALVLCWKGGKRVVQQFLIDRLSTMVAEELRNLPPSRS